jgi:2-methylcitrate dehydratase PrpD
LAQFEPNRYDDPKLRRFAAEQVEARADASITGSQAIVDVETANGATFSERCEHPLGSYENPLSRAQIEQKFRTYAKGALSDADAAEVVAAVDRLQDLGSVRKLMELLGPTPRAMAAAE